eukprot:15485203-Alexandrium_andersonii.AAC.1
MLAHARVRVPTRVFASARVDPLASIPELAQLRWQGARVRSGARQRACLPELSQRAVRGLPLPRIVAVQIEALGTQPSD